MRKVYRDDDDDKVNDKDDENAEVVKAEEDDKKGETNSVFWFSMLRRKPSAAEGRRAKWKREKVEREELRKSK